MPRREMMMRMSAREFAEWQAYYALEPFGAERDAAHAGIVAATIANFSGFRKEGTVFKPSDFMIDYAQERVHTPEQEELMQTMRDQSLREALRALAKADHGDHS